MHHKFVLVFLLCLTVMALVSTRPAAAQTTAITETATMAPPTLTSVPPTPTLTATSSIEQRLTSVEQNLVEIEKKVEQPKKDIWDILESITGLLTGGVVAVILWLLGNGYTEAQKKREEALKVQEITVTKVQTVQTFMPQLQSGDPKSVKAALLAISALNQPELSTSLAELYRDEGSIAALQQMAASSQKITADAANEALGKLFDQALRSMAYIERGGERRGVGFFVREDGYVLTTENAIHADGDVLVVTGNVQRPAQIIKQDNDANLALLRVSGVAFPSLAPEESALSTFNTVYLIGRETGGSLVVNEGKVAGKGTLEGYPHDLATVEIHIPLTYGGSPALTADGKFAGMVVMMHHPDGRLTDRVYLLSSSILAAFVDTNI